MDALKRAEQANQEGHAIHQLPEDSRLTLEPVSAEPSQPTTLPGEESPTTSLPELPKLEALDDQFLAHVKQPAIRSKSSASSPPGSQKGTNPRFQQDVGSGTKGTRTGVTEMTPEREAILNVFAAKRPAVTVPGRPFFLATGIATAVAVAAIGTYFWYQLRPAPGLALTMPEVTGVARPAPNPIASIPIAPTPITPAAATATVATQPEVSAEAPAIRKKESASSAVATPAPAEPHVVEAPQPRIDPGMEPIRFSKSRPKADPAADEGYASFHAGDIAAAKSAYGRQLERDPRNVPALHGLAAIALREGRIGDAEAAYQRALAIDPRDAIANAGLLGIRSDTDPVAGEARMKSLLAVQPDMHILHFALGNLYARQNRWSEAQQAYFSAYRGDSDNPDYLFNLAASLDQLHQPKLAGQYYEQALKAVEKRPATFDRNLATARLRELQR